MVTMVRFDAFFVKCGVRPHVVVETIREGVTTAVFGLPLHVFAWVRLVPEADAD